MILISHYRLGVTCTDGKLWTEHRSFTIRHLREAGFGRQSMEAEIHREIDELTSTIDEYKNEALWPRKLLSLNVINVLWTFTAGKHFTRNDKQLEILLNLMEKRSKAFDTAGGLLNQLPWLRHFAPEYTGYTLITNLNNQFKNFFQKTIREHYDSYSADKVKDDLIYAYINEMENQKSNPDSTFTEIQLIMIILDIFIAGSQTTSITIDLALMITAMRPDIQEKVHNEIDKYLKDPSNGERSSYSKLNLNYIKAVIYEVERFFYIVPLSGPRRVLTDTSLGGYRIPKNTTILMSLKSVHMDDEYWVNPDEFQPERFLTKDGELINNERLIPFGQGKRKCLGDALAKACIVDFYVGIMKKYSLSFPEGVEKPSLNLLPGIVRSPKEYKILFSKRNT